MRLSIRKLNKNDIPEVSKVIQRAYDITIRISNMYSKGLVDSFIESYTLKSFTNKLKEKGGTYFVAKLNNKIVGIIGLKVNDKEINSCYLSTFYVDPDFLKKGIGRKLFERFIKETKKNDIKKIFVKSSTYAEKIYERLGFVKLNEIKKEKNGFNYNDILMELVN